MSDLRQTSAMFNKYFQDRRIRRYLISAGLINRHGDILPPTPEQVARARRVTQQQIEDNYYNEKEDEGKNRSGVSFSPKRSRAEKNKSSKQSRKDASNSHHSPSPSKKKRAQSAYQRSQDSVQSTSFNSTRSKSPTQPLCEVSMIYYGPKSPYDYDNCWFKPDGDEIMVSQQHCGGENLTVYRGHVKPGGNAKIFLPLSCIRVEIDLGTFKFLSRRHRGYPFALSLYVNGLVKSRISVCCEYKHKRNVPLDGKHGLFGIHDVQKVTPCLSCRYEREKKKTRKDKLASTSDQSRYQKSTVRHPQPETRKPRRKDSLRSSSSDSTTLRLQSPRVSRTSSSDTDEKPTRPVTAPQSNQHASAKGKPSSTKKNASKQKTGVHEDTYRSNSDGSQNDDHPTANSKHSSLPSATSKNKPASPVKANGNSDTQTYTKKSSKPASKKHFGSEGSDQSSETTAKKSNNLTYGRISPSKPMRRSESSEDDQKTPSAKIVPKKASTQNHARDSSPETPQRNTKIDSLMKSIPMLQKHLDDSEENDSTRSPKSTPKETDTPSHVRRSQSSDDDTRKSPPITHTQYDSPEGNQESRKANNVSDDAKYSSFGSENNDYSDDDEEEDEYSDENRSSDQSKSKKNSTDSGRKPPVKPLKRFGSSEDENVNPTSPTKAKSNIFDDEYTPRMSTERNNLFDTPTKPSQSSGRPLKTQTTEDETIDQFFSSATRDDEPSHRRPLSSAVHRDRESSPPNTTTSRLFEELFGDTQRSTTTQQPNSSSKTKPRSRFDILDDDDDNAE
ncbi:unnamed protein product [Adineta ricciae]|uniref:DUF4590 domain-containing protein n=1 Tax=Adineta ricciae TaxID=249248 RepID=A0A813NHR5_ADIRI|nr:unnamed protein product [Adineta ricciae]